MKSAQNKELSVLYYSLKKEYQELLDKHQNQMIKIRLREKQLNERIAVMQKEKQEMEIRYKDQICALKKCISQLQSNPDQKNSFESSKNQQQFTKQKDEGIYLKKKIEEQTNEIVNHLVKEKDLQGQIESLKLALKDRKRQLEQSAQKQSKSNQLEKDREIQASQYEINCIKEKIMSLSAELHKQRKDKVQMQEQFNLKIQQLQKVISKERDQLQSKMQQNKLQSQHNQSILKKRLAQSNNILTIEMESKKKLQHLLQINLQELKDLELQHQALNKKFTSQQQQPCYKCEQLKQQLQLNAQMLKSVKMMLKFKEIELEELKK